MYRNETISGSDVSNHSSATSVVLTTLGVRRNLVSTTAATPKIERTLKKTMRGHERTVGFTDRGDARFEADGVREKSRQYICDG